VLARRQAGEHVATRLVREGGATECRDLHARAFEVITRGSIADGAGEHTGVSGAQPRWGEQGEENGSGNRDNTRTADEWAQQSTANGR
jgi:hypothetical protein